MNLITSEGLLHWVVPLLPLSAVLVAGFIATSFIGGWLRRRSQRRESNFSHTLITLAVGLVFVLAAILVLPVDDEMRKQLLALLGLLLTLMMAFSSTSFVANAMAGFMLRGVDNFHPGDFIRVGEQFGRVTERGLFHTEIQTEERDLTTIPNLYLVSNPVSVVRSSGTIISAEVSLGYDVELADVEACLLAAAERSELLESFVYVKDLNDFSVVYRVSGFLQEVKQLLTVRSVLRKNMIKSLHSAGVEIVSPHYMNQRPLDARHKTIGLGGDLADLSGGAAENGLSVKKTPESLVFDKAESAEKKAILEQRRRWLEEKIARLKKEASTEERNTDAFTKKIEGLEQRLAYVLRTTEKLKGELGSG